MKLLREIERALGAEAGIGLQYTVIAGKGAYFQNVKKVEEFSDRAIVFRAGKGGVRVEGSGLSLGKYGGGDAAVLGDIFKVEKL